LAAGEDGCAGGSDAGWLDWAGFSCATSAPIGKIMAVAMTVESRRRRTAERLIDFSPSGQIPAGRVGRAPTAGRQQSDHKPQSRHFLSKARD
jgi:hypothetical protein